MYEKLEYLMKEKGVTPADISKATGIGKSTFTGWKNGSYTPKADKLYAIAQYFGVPMEYFFNPEEDYEKIQNDINGYLDKAKPLYRTAAGDGVYNDTYADETIDEDDGYEYATVCGESMSPALHDGDIVKIQPQTETTPHDYTLVKVDGEHATIKFVEIVDNGVWLRALNQEVYKDRFFSIQEVMTLPITIIGKVVELKRKF